MRRSGNFMWNGCRTQNGMEVLHSTKTDGEYISFSDPTWKNGPVPSFRSGPGRLQLGTTLADFSSGTSRYHPEEDVIVCFYTSLSYTLGALLDAFRFLIGESCPGRTALRIAGAARDCGGETKSSEIPWVAISSRLNSPKKL